MSFAVLDFETTGILPSHNHRVIEIGVTHVEDDGSISGHWETLVNPQRDLGPQHIHGIRGADLIDAPLFEDIAPDLLALLRDRTFVAHNASFDLRFLIAEFSRSGLYFGDSLPHICTMKLSQSFGVPGRGALDSCCAHFGVDLVNAHTAGADSLATGQLLSAYMDATRTMSEWAAYWAEVGQMGRGFPLPSPTTRGVAWKARGESFSEPQHFLERISDPPLEVKVEGAEVAYLDALDRVLIDRSISASEQAELIAVAGELGISRTEADLLNRKYFDALQQRAWADGVLTQEELGELIAVSEALAIPADDWNSERFSSDSQPTQWAPTEFKLDPGDHIVLTGDMQIERTEWELLLIAAGFVPHPRITKKTKVLVSADPDSGSGKAQQARKYGIPVVGEGWLRENLV